MLKVCLQSLRLHVNPTETRIVVVDNASSDGSPQMVESEFPEVTLVHSGANLGFGKGHNLLAKCSSEPYILFLNPDTEFIEAAHEKMLQIFENDPKVGAVSCMLVDPDGSVNPLGIQWYPSPITEFFSHLFLSATVLKVIGKFLPHHDPHKNGTVRKLYGGCLMVRRDVLDRVGWFDERFFMYGEDVDLSRRIFESGLQLYHVGDTRVIHTGGGASSKAPGKFAVLMQCESIGKLLQKHYGFLGRFAYNVAVFLRACSRLLFLYVLQPAIAVFSPRRLPSWKGSQSKQIAMLKWSLGLLHPAVPK